MAEKSEEDEQMETTGEMRNLNSQLQLKLMEAEKQAKDAIQQLAELQDQNAQEQENTQMLREQLAEMQEKFNALLTKKEAIEQSSISREDVEDVEEDEHQNIIMNSPVPPSNMSQYANEVKQ